MSTDTGPAELAELLSDPKKRDVWIILTLQEIKTDLAQHVIEDKTQFAQLREGQNIVSSAVIPLTETKNKFSWSWKVAAGAFFGVAFLVDLAAHAKELFK